QTGDVLVDRVEVVDTEGPDFGPPRVVAGVRRDRLVELDPARVAVDTILRFVTRRVDTRELEQQRAGLPSTTHVEEPRIFLQLARESVGERHRDGLITMPELVHDRGIEREGAETPARVDTDRVAIFD